MSISGPCRPVIEVSGIRKTYGATVAVSDVSFEVSEGEIFGLIGPNGAGKTTTMEWRRRSAPAGQGRHFDPGPGSVARRARVAEPHWSATPTGAAPEEDQSVWEAVDLWGSLYSKAVDGDRLLEQLGLSSKRNAWFMTLSGGQKQRLFIALALINDPE